MVARLTYLNASMHTGVSEDTWKKAWDYTRLISPHPEVKKADRDAYGDAVNDYHLTHAVGPVVPLAPWAVHLADQQLHYRLLCFDFDTGDGSPDAVETAQDDADALSILLGQVSINHLVCESSTKGGRHVWVAIADQAPASLVQQIGQAAKVILPSLDWGMLKNPTQGAARPPLSPHRNGSFSRPVRGSLDTLLIPSTATTDLELLLEALYERAPQPAPATAPTSTVAFTAPGQPLRGPGPLRGRGADYLYTPGGGENPSWTGWMCLLHMASAGWDYSSVQAAAATAPGMETYRTRKSGNRGERRARSAADADRRLAGQWEQVTARAAIWRALPAGPREPKDVSDLAGQVQLVDDLLTSFRVAPGRWGGRYGAPTRKTVLRALAYLMLTSGQRRVTAATRTLAELCNIDQSTAARALVQLQTDGWVVKVSESQGINAATWALTGPGHFSTPSDTGATHPLKNTPPLRDLYAKRATLIEEIEASLAALRHDVFTYQGLGHLAGQVWAHLRTKTSVTVAELAKRSGIGISHATAILSRLRSCRLLKKAPDDRWTAVARDLRTRAAVLLQVDGTIEQRLARYADDRKLWRWWCAEVDRMCSRPKERPKQRHVTERPLTWVEAETGEFEWPLYPRVGDEPAARADHRVARTEVEAGYLSPASRWRLPAAA